MELVGTRRVFAAGDLVDFIACAHLATLGDAVAMGERARPAPSEEEQQLHAELLGELHLALRLQLVLHLEVALQRPHLVERQPALLLEVRPDGGEIVASVVPVLGSILHRGAVVGREEGALLPDSSLHRDGVFQPSHMSRRCNTTTKQNQDDIHPNQYQIQELQVLCTLLSKLRVGSPPDAPCRPGPSIADSESEELSFRMSCIPLPGPL